MFNQENISLQQKKYFDNQKELLKDGLSQALQNGLLEEGRAASNSYSLRQRHDEHAMPPDLSEIHQLFAELNNISDQVFLKTEGLFQELKFISRQENQAIEKKVSVPLQPASCGMAIELQENIRKLRNLGDFLDHIRHSICI